LKQSAVFGSFQCFRAALHVPIASPAITPA
jgi:hypothetical protein